MRLSASPAIVWICPAAFILIVIVGLAFDITQFNTVTAHQRASDIRTFDNQFNNLRRDPVKQLDVSMTKNFAKNYLTHPIKRSTTTMVLIYRSSCQEDGASSVSPKALRLPACGNNAPTRVCAGTDARAAC